MTIKSTLPLFVETTAWLLESQTPSIRYLTLKRIMGLPDNDPRIIQSRQAIALNPPVSRILAKQQAEGYWVEAKHIYSPKFRSSHWSMLLLTELGLEPENAGLQVGAEFMLAAVEKDQQYFSRKEKGFGCFWGNWLRYQLYCRKGEKELVKQVIEFTCADILRGGQCRYNSDLPCAWAVARDLFGLALIPDEQRSVDVQNAITAGIHFLMVEYDLLAVNYPADNKNHPLWEKLSFPLYYHTDRLFILRILKELDSLSHPKAQEALAWLLARRSKSGIWHGGSPFRDRSRPFLAEADGVERWISLHALDVLS